MDTKSWIIAWILKSDCYPWYIALSILLLILSPVRYWLFMLNDVHGYAAQHTGYLIGCYLEFCREREEKLLEWIETILQYDLLLTMKADDLLLTFSSTARNYWKERKQLVPLWGQNVEQPLVCPLCHWGELLQVCGAQSRNSLACRGSESRGHPKQ